MSRFNLYIFDLDGTILDSKEDIAIAVNYGLKKVGLKERDTQEIVRFVGYGAKKLIDDLLPEFNEDIRKEVLGYFREFYTQNPVIKSTLYPGVEDILKNLKNSGKKVSIVTNKYEEISKRIIEHFKIDRYIDLVVGADTTSEKKPNPKPVFYTLEKLEEDKEKSILIGDSETDIQTSKNASISGCLVLHGYGNKELALKLNPDFIIKDFYEFEVIR
ncbi:MAG: HAD-IA family hydrolase [Hydrogenothermaceae bacterium]|nr:HAD-IA family hydrolase [Hydrogenothermaceae bacterium]